MHKSITSLIVIFALVFSLLVFVPRSVKAQAVVFTPTCVGNATLDTASLTAQTAAIGVTNTGKIQIPYKSNAAQKCKFNTATITSNITLDNWIGSGVEVVAGQTLTIQGTFTAPTNKQSFYGTGTILLASQTVESAWFPGGADWGAKVNAADTALGANKGTIIARGDGNIATGIVISENRTFLPGPGTRTSTALGPVVRLKSNTTIDCGGWNSIFTESTGLRDPVTEVEGLVVIASYYGTSSDALNGTIGQNINVKNCHIKGHTPITTTDAAMADASTTLTSATANFAANMVGWTVGVTGAGPAPTNNLRAVITAVTSSTEVTLDTASSAAVSGAKLFVAHFDSAPSTITMGNLHSGSVVNNWLDDTHTIGIGIGGGSDTTGGAGTGTKTITGATNASPIVITSVGHGYAIGPTGTRVKIASVSGNTAANGFWDITVLTANTFSLNFSTGNGAYTSGGTAKQLGYAQNVLVEGNLLTGVSSQNLAATNARGITFSNNTVRKPGQAYGPGVAVFDVEPNTSDTIRAITIKNNLIDTTESPYDTDGSGGAKVLHGIAIQNPASTAPEFGPIDVIGNTIIGTLSANAAGNNISGSGIILGACTNTRVKGNYIKRTQTGIWAINSNFNWIEDNTLISVGSGGADYAIRIEDSSNNFVASNRIYNDTSDALTATVDRTIIETTTGGTPSDNNRYIVNYASPITITGGGSTIRPIDTDPIYNSITSGAGTFSGQITSTVTTGTPAFVVASTTNIPNLNASTLSGATFASPGSIGSTTPGTGQFTFATAEPTAGATGEFRFREIAANGTNYLGLKAPTSVAANQVWTLPPAFCTAGQIWQDNGSGVLSCTANSATGMANPMTTIGDIIYASNTAAPSTPARLAIGTVGQVLTVSAGGIPEWGAGGGAGAPCGSTTQVQFNLAGACGADAAFAWNNTTKALSLGAATVGVHVPLLLRNTNNGTGSTTEFHLGNDTAVDTFAFRVNSGTFTSENNTASIFNRQNAALAFGTNNTERMRIAAGGAVTMTMTLDVAGHMALGATASIDQPVGATTGPVMLNARETFSTFAGSDSKYNGGFFWLTIDPGNNQPVGHEIYGNRAISEVTVGNIRTFAGTTYGMVGETFFGGTGVMTKGVGVYGDYNHNASGNTTTAYGVEGRFWTFGAPGGGTVTTAVAGRFNFLNNSATTITDARGVAATIQQTQPGAITTAYALQATTPENSGGGTIGTLVGLHISDHSGLTGVTTAFNFRSAGVNSINYMEGKLGIGTTTPYLPFHVGDSTATTGVTMLGGLISTDTAAGTVFGIRKSSSTTNSASFGFFKSRGTNAAPSIVANSDEVGVITGFAFDGTNYIRAASITATIDGTPGVNDMPGRLVFNVTPDGTASVVEAMRITNAQRVGIGTTTPATPLEVNGIIRGAIQDKGGQVFNVLTYGAIPDDTVDDTAAIQSAIDAVPVSGGVVLVPRGNYRITSTLTIGDGNSTTVSTKGYLTFMGDGSGPTADEMIPAAFSLARGTTTLSWHGAPGGTMLQINGPIGNIKVKGMFFDAFGVDADAGTDRAGTAIAVIHAMDSTFQEITVARQTGFAFTITAYTVSVGGFAKGADDNHWEQVHNQDVGTNGSGIQIGPATKGAGTLDVARNTFLNCSFREDGTGKGIELRFTDALTFINILGGKLVVTPPSDSLGFPGGVVFYNSAIEVDNTSGSNWVGDEAISFYPHPTGDYAGTPTAVWARGVTATGVPFGGTTTITSSATPAPNAKVTNYYVISALAANAAVGAPTFGSSGSPIQGQKLSFSITDNGTSRTLTWDAAYRAGTDYTLPAATTLGKTMYLQFQYNSTASKWDLIQLARGF